MKKTQNLLPPKTGVGYIRESTEEQDKGFAPQAQERSIRDYAKKNNIKIVEIYKDLISGKVAAKRADFQRMIGEAMQNKFEVILVFHTSRFARNVGEARQYKNLLRKKLNIDVVSTTQPFGDFNDPNAFLNEGVNELFDEYYSRQLGFFLKNALMEKRKQGKPSGNPPLGYYKKKIGFDKETGRVIYSREWHIDKKAAPVVKRIFKLYATGRYSMSAIANILTKERLKTNYGNDFTYSSIKGTLASKAYLGLVYSPRKDRPDIKSVYHKAIVPKELYYKCQDIMRERSQKFGRPVAQHRFYLLQGLVYCYNCIEWLKKRRKDKTKSMLPAMYCYANRWETGEKRFYSCKFRRENGTCDQKVECGIIDKQVIQLMNGFSLPKETIGHSLAKLKDMFQNYRRDKKTEDRLSKLLDKKGRLKAIFENGHSTEEEFLFKTQQVDEEIGQVERQTIIGSMTARQEEQFVKKTEDFLSDFSKFWNSGLPEKEIRNWIQMVIKRVWVKGEKVVAIEPRDEYKPWFKAHQKVIGQYPLATPVGIFV